MVVETHPNGAIQLSAGIVEDGARLVTRAVGENEQDAHANHLTLTTGTKLGLYVSGTWTGHSPETVIKNTTAEVGAETTAGEPATGTKHNSLTTSPVLYWDDYGTADPANESTGRAGGLTIYGVAINGKTSIPSDLTSLAASTTLSEWQSLSWVLPADQSSNWSDKDLLISNNIQGTATSGKEYDTGAYKFSERGSGKLLEFRHAMSKITVNLKAGAGFTGGVFAADPTVMLINNWAYTTGTINVTTGAVSSQSGATVITMNQTATATTGYNVTKEALVIPGSAFASDASEIVKVNADGNIYYVTAEKIRAKITELNLKTGDDFLTLAGKNYILNVTVNKTDIEVTATVTDWTDVTAAEVEPVINISTSYGVAPDNETIFTKDEFSFYRRTSTESTYSDGLIENNYYKEIRRVKKSGSDWTMNIYSNNTWEVSNLYWPDHNTHYQFRGVWPYTKTGTGDVDYPRVEMVNSEQVIKVQNVAYTANSFPSDLQIGRPDVDTNETCTNTEAGHTTSNLWTDGICATEGKINIKFQYIMSQVEVNLSTTGASDPDKVKLENAKVEIVNVHKTGNVKLDDRTVTPTGTVTTPTPDPVNDTFGDYELGNYSYNSETRIANYRSAVVPQVLTYTAAQAAGNVKFRITITNDDGSKDVYYADIYPILETGLATRVAPTGRWESGYHYVYNLRLTKTEVKVTATLANWTTVNASENVWF